MADNQELQHATLKTLDISAEVKMLTGFIDLTDEEKFFEEEAKEKMNSQDQLIRLNDDNDGFDINIQVKGNSILAPKQNLKKPEKSIKFMQKKGLIKK
jgi:hypothetical protein